MDLKARNRTILSGDISSILDSIHADCMVYFKTISTKHVQEYYFTFRHYLILIPSKEKREQTQPSSKKDG